MSEGSGGEPEREQDRWSQPAGSAQPGQAAAQPEAAGYQSAAPDSWSTAWACPASPAAPPEPAGYPSGGPDSWSTTWAKPDSAARPTPPAQPGSSDGTDRQLAPQPNGFSPAQDPSAAPPGGQYGYQAPDGQYPPSDEQYGYQSTAGQYPQVAGQYGSQQWPAATAAPRNNRVAIAALVCGVGQFVLGLLIVGNILLAIPAIVCGAIGLKQTRQRGEGGRAMAIAGLVLGILGVVYFVIIVGVLIILASIHHSGSS